MSAEQTKQVVRRMAELGMIEGDVDGAVAAYSPHVVYHNPMLAGMSPGTPATDAIAQMTRATRLAFPDIRYSIEALIAEGDTAAVLYTWTGTHAGHLGGLAPTGRTVQATGVMVCRVADGRIVEEWDVDDRFDVLQQLGLLPPVSA